MSTFRLQIVAPDKMIYNDEAKSIMVRTVNGDVRILAGHIDYVAPLGIGVAEVVDVNGAAKTAAINGGLISVSNGEVRVICTTFEWSDDINLARAEHAKIEAEERLKNMKQGDRDFAINEAKLKRAITRIQVKDR